MRFSINPSLPDINEYLSKMKEELESVIESATYKNKSYENGSKAKEGFIRGSGFINHLHEFIKLYSLSFFGLHGSQIIPPIGQKSGELNATGYFKKKRQDISLVPISLKKEAIPITKGPLATEKIFDEYGKTYMENSILINVRSQMSSLNKNTDTLFERTFAEAYNLHMAYPNIVLGEVYLIPVFEYDEDAAKDNNVRFSSTPTKLEKYISFFYELNNRNQAYSDSFIINSHKYEAVWLIIVDFSKNKPKLYKTTQELVNDGLIRSDFPLELADLSLENFFNTLKSAFNGRPTIQKY